MIATSFAQRIEANTRYWLSVLENVEERVYAPLDPEWPNLLQSVQFAIQHPETRAGAAELWAAAIGYVEARGYLDSWRIPASVLAGEIKTLDPALGCRVANELGFFFTKSWDFPNAIRMHTFAQQAAQECGDPLQETLALLGFASVDQAENRFQEAEGRTRQAIAALESLDPGGVRLASAHNLLGLILMGQGAHEDAIAHYKRALATYQQVGHTRKAVLAIHNIAMSQRLGGDPMASIETLRPVEKMISADDQPGAWANLHLSLGTAYFEMGDYPRAREMFLRIDQNTLEANGLLEPLALTSNNLGNVALKEEDWPLAVDYLTYSAGLFGQLGSQVHQANSLGDLGTALEQLGRREEALAAVDEALELLEKHPENDWARKRRAAILAQREALTGP